MAAHQPKRFDLKSWLNILLVDLSRPSVVIQELSNSTILKEIKQPYICRACMKKHFWNFVLLLMALFHSARSHWVGRTTARQKCHWQSFALECCPWCWGGRRSDTAVLLAAARESHRITLHVQGHTHAYPRTRAHSSPYLVIMRKKWSQWDACVTVTDSRRSDWSCITARWHLVAPSSPQASPTAVCLF